MDILELLDFISGIFLPSNKMSEFLFIEIELINKSINTNILHEKDIQLDLFFKESKFA